MAGIGFSSAIAELIIAHIHTAMLSIPVTISKNSMASRKPASARSTSCKTPNGKESLESGITIPIRACGKALIFAAAYRRIGLPLLTERRRQGRRPRHAVH